MELVLTAYTVDSKSMPAYMKYIFGGMAGVSATTIVQPMDFVKVQMQMTAMANGGKSKYSSTWDCMKKVAKNQGLLAFYRGISAAWFRSATYTTTRMGVYQMEVEKYNKMYQKHPHLLASMGMGIVAGACGAMVGNPADVSLIRMTSDNKLPPNERRNYKNVVDAITRIIREEGVLKLWRGAIPTTTRAMVVNMVQLASYSQIKEKVHKTFNVKQGIKLHIIASMCAGLLTTMVSMPLDMAKTRLQQQKEPIYKGTFDVLTKISKSDGLFALWKGFTPYLCRIGPHTVLSLLILEQLNIAYNRYVLGMNRDSGI